MEKTACQLHWDNIYQNKAFDAVSWYQAVPQASLDTIQSLALSFTAPIIDVGGGDAYLAEHLLQQGYTDITVLDISAEVLHRAQNRLGEWAPNIHWICDDITHTTLPQTYAFWHDRAVFHFLTQAHHQAHYIELARHYVAPQGFMLIGTFAEDGPEKCSGIPVQRYSAEALQAQFAADFNVVRHWRDMHTTPFQTQQAFTFVLFQRVSC